MGDPAQTLEDVYALFDGIPPSEDGCVYFHLHNYNRPVRISGKVIRASRIVLERKLGRQIKSGYFALHNCDHRGCINSDHIYEGTRQNNVDDMIERNPNAYAHTRTPEARSFMRSVSAKGAEAQKQKYETDPEFRIRKQAANRINLAKANAALGRVYRNNTNTGD